MLRYVSFCSYFYHLTSFFYNNLFCFGFDNSQTVCALFVTNHFCKPYRISSCDFLSIFLCSIFCFKNYDVLIEIDQKVDFRSKKLEQKLLISSSNVVFYFVIEVLFWKFLMKKSRSPQLGTHFLGEVICLVSRKNILRVRVQSFSEPPVLRMIH